MLFDLQGKRRRVVQATYLTLAVLMGGGLVLFGIGGDVSGGLFDAFSDRSGGSSGDPVAKRIERNEDALKKRGPAREAAMEELVRDFYSLASQGTSDTGELDDQAREDLTNATKIWERYVKEVAEKPDPGTAQYAMFSYEALGKNEEALAAAQILAEANNDPASYLNVVKFASAVGNTRIADLAGQKAIELATKGEKDAVRANVKALKASPTGASTTVPGG